MSSEENLWVLAAALESEYISLSDLVAWAGQQVLRLDSPPSWLLDLCLAGTKEDGRRLLRVAWDRHTGSEGTTRQGCERHDDLYLGFLYLRFEHGDLMMAELLNLAGQYSDGSGCEIDCEAFYLLLNEIDGGGPTIPSDEPLRERIRDLFAPMTELTRRYLDLLPMRDHPHGVSFTNEGDCPLGMVSRDLCKIAAFLQGLAPFSRLVRYEDWHDHDRGNFERCPTDFHGLFQLVQTPRALLAATPDDHDVCVGIAAEDRGWYLRFRTDWDDQDENLVGFLALTLNEGLVNRFEDEIVPNLDCPVRRVDPGEA